MDKVFSTRLDESVADRIGDLARRLQTSKKQVIEDAVALMESTLGDSASTSFLDQSFGAWQREESTEETVEEARKPFRKSFDRHRQ